MIWTVFTKLSASRPGNKGSGPAKTNITSHFSVLATFPFSTSVTLPLTFTTLSSLSTRANDDGICTREQLRAGAKWNWFYVSFTGLLPTSLVMNKRQPGLFEHQPCPRFRTVSQKSGSYELQHEGMIKLPHNTTLLFTPGSFLLVNSHQFLYIHFSVYTTY